MEQKRHTDREYEAELGRVRDNLLRMTGRVEQMIADSVEALLEGDTDLAQKAIEDDHKVNRLEVDTDDLCLLILARRQPLGSDLRFITLAMKMVTDLERIGDLAVNIAERAVALSGERPVGFESLLSRLAELDQAQLRGAIEAFVARDAAAAEAVCAADDQVDRLYLELAREAQEKMAGDGGVRIERAVHLQAVARFLERIGDHVTNLAELVIFLVRGKDVRHLGKLDDG
ncbi:MAG TPA: phosphate signaling complex protein PhoU [Kofleriaceae bacterium]|nr:phosphate signaling complex protein PhoU [Kofleriaceae bacterium]